MLTEITNHFVYRLWYIYLLRTVLQFCHDLETAADLGVKKTLARIRQKYYWPGLQSDTRAYITDCEKCSIMESAQKKSKALMTLVESGLPMDIIATGSW